MTRLQAVKKLLPFILPVVAVVAVAVVYIRLSCVDGGQSLCQNATEFINQTTPYQTPFQQFMNLFTFG